jgi:hypothetical protein
VSLKSPRESAPSSGSINIWGVVLSALALLVALVLPFVDIEPVLTVKATWLGTAFHNVAPFLSWILPAAAGFALGWFVSPRRKRVPSMSEVAALMHESETRAAHPKVPALRHGLSKSQKLDLLRSLKTQLAALTIGDETGLSRLQKRAQMITKQVFGEPSGGRCRDIGEASHFAPLYINQIRQDDRPRWNRVVSEMNALLDTWIEEIGLSE